MLHNVPVLGVWKRFWFLWFAIELVKEIENNYVCCWGCWFCRAIIFNSINLAFFLFERKWNLKSMNVLSMFLLLQVWTIVITHSILRICETVWKHCCLMHLLMYYQHHKAYSTAGWGITTCSQALQQVKIVLVSFIVSFSFSCVCRNNLFIDYWLFLLVEANTGYLMSMVWLI